VKISLVGITKDAQVVKCLVSVAKRMTSWQVARGGSTLDHMETMEETCQSKWAIRVMVGDSLL
jgi:hypothetical protein